MRSIILGRSALYEALVSDEDYTFLVRWAWNFKRSRKAFGEKVYARRTLHVAGGYITLLMHIVVLERMGLPRPPGTTGEHLDRNSLNNQRENLTWATKSQQNLNRVLPTSASASASVARSPDFFE